jgi:hypothetical protein
VCVLVAFILFYSLYVLRGAPNSVVLSVSLINSIRKKKCDDVSIPCHICRRLGLQCNRKTKIIWEDDPRRDGMRRRGPYTSTKKPSQPPGVDFAENRPAPSKMVSQALSNWSHLNPIDRVHLTDTSNTFHAYTLPVVIPAIPSCECYCL